MIIDRKRFGVVMLLSSTSLLGCGGGFGSIAVYPEAYAVPEFEEYRLTTDAFPTYWKCSLESSGTICEATITRNDNGAYVAELAVSSNDQFSYGEKPPGILDHQFDLIYLPPRILTEQEADRMDALFSDLHINRNPLPYSHVCCLGLRLQRVHRWDDVQLGTHTRDGAMIDFSDSSDIVGFLYELMPPALPMAQTPSRAD